MDPVRLGRRIEQLRVALGMSRPVFAKKARLNRSDLWRIEKGRGPTAVGLKRLQRIADALGVHIIDLIVNGGAGGSPSKSTKRS